MVWVEVLMDAVGLEPDNWVVIREVASSLFVGEVPVAGGKGVIVEEAGKLPCGVYKLQE